MAAVLPQSVKGFCYIHTPIITGSDAEGAGEMFRVTVLDSKNPKYRIKMTSSSLKIEVHYLSP